MSSPRILIVDDDRSNRELLGLILDQEGFTTSTAASGEEALASVARQPPDLILLDLMMPGMNGYQVTARLKGAVGTAKIPVVMVSALDDLATRRLATDAGANSFLTKPLDCAAVCLCLRRLLPQA